MMVERRHGMQVRLLQRAEYQGGGQERERVLCAAPCRLATLMTTPETARASSRPPQYQDWPSTDCGEAEPATWVSIVRSNPPR